MAWRTTAELVKEELKRDYDTVNEPSLSGSVRKGNLLTDRVATHAAATGVSLSASELAEIECLLAAHFYCVSDRPFAEEWTGKAKAVYQGKTDTGLNSSHYGQAAVLLDASGYLASIADGTRRTASLAWLGKTASEELSYDERN